MKGGLTCSHDETLTCEVNDCFCHNTQKLQKEFLKLDVFLLFIELNTNITLIIKNSAKAIKIFIKYTFWSRG